MILYPTAFFFLHCSEVPQRTGNDGLIANASMVSPDTGEYDALTVHLYLPSANLTWLDCLARHPPALWPSVLGAFPDAAIARTFNSSRLWFKGAPKLWLTETQMGGGSAHISLEPNTSAVERFTILAFVAPVSALNKAGFLLSAASRPDQVAMMHHHSLLYDPSGAAASAALWSHDPFGMVWMKQKSCGSKPSCGHWPFADSVPRIAASAHVFARIAGAARSSRSVHACQVGGGAPLGATILGEPAEALQAAAFSTAPPGDGTGWRDDSVAMCVVVLNRGVTAVEATVSLPPDSIDISPWKQATAVALDASRRECKGDGRSCWSPIPDEAIPAEAWNGPLPVISNISVRVRPGSMAVVLTVPPLCIAFVRLMPLDGGASAAAMRC